MGARTEIIELVDSIFDTVDAKDWDAAEKLFEPTVVADFGEAATMSNIDLVDGWRQGLHPKKKSFHLVSHYRVRVNGDTATVAVKGYAYNVLDEDLGGGMWEVWGAYEIPLRRTEAGWRASGITFRAWHTRGDDSVRAHTLTSLPVHDAPASRLPSYASGAGVRVAEIRGGGPQVGGPQVVVADQLELALIGLVRSHPAIVGRLADGPARPSVLLVCSPSDPQLVDVFFVGLGMRVMPCRALAHALTSAVGRQQRRLSLPARSGGALTE